MEFRAEDGFARRSAVPGIGGVDSDAVGGDAGLGCGAEGGIGEARLLREFVEAGREFGAVGDVRDAGEFDGFVAGARSGPSLRSARSLRG